MENSSFQSGNGEVTTTAIQATAESLAAQWKKYKNAEKVIEAFKDTEKELLALMLEAKIDKVENKNFRFTAVVSDKPREVFNKALFTAKHPKLAAEFTELADPAKPYLRTSHLI